MVTAPSSSSSPPYHPHFPHPQQHFGCSIFILEEEEEEEGQEHSDLLLDHNDDDEDDFLTPSNSFNRRHRLGLPSPSSPSSSPLLFFTPRSSFSRLYPPSSATIHPHPSARSAAISQSRSTSALPADKEMAKSLSRNSSADSLNSSAPLMFSASPPRMSFGGSTPNGVGGPHQQHNLLHFARPMGKRSFAGTGLRESSELSQSAAAAHQHRSPLFTAAILNNSTNEYLQHHHHHPQQHPFFSLYEQYPPSQQSSRPTVMQQQQQQRAWASVTGTGDCDSITVAESTASPPTAPAATMANNNGSRIYGQNRAIKTTGFTDLQQLELEPLNKHRGELSINERYRYDLSRAQLKASSRTSALLSGFAMVALVELQYQDTTPKPLLILLAVVTTLLVSVHLLALMMSTCLLPYIEANGCTQDSPHIKLRFYIELSWLFSTCIGLLLFLLEIGVIFFVKFNSINYNLAAYITTGMLVPVVIVFIIISYLIHRNRFTHSIERVSDKVTDLQKFIYESELNVGINMVPPTKNNSIQRNMMNAGLQGVSVIKNVK